jgi:hypothetical protein
VSVKDGDEERTDEIMSQRACQFIGTIICGANVKERDKDTGEADPE